MRIFLLVVFASSCVASFGSSSKRHLEQALPINNQSLVETSDYWPARVSYNNEFIGEMHGNKVPAHSEGLLVRVEDDHCIIDYGHNGIIAVPYDHTDIIKRIKANKQAKKLDQLSFAFRWIKSFYVPSKRRPCQFEDYREHRQFLIVFFSPDSHLEAALALCHNKKVLNDIEPDSILLIPDQELSLEQIYYLRDEKIDCPTIVGDHRNAFLRGIRLQPIGDGIYGYLLNKNGKVLKALNDLQLKN